MVSGPNLEFFRANVADDIALACTATVLEQYGLSYDRAEEQWLGPELHDALAVMRRADIETALVKLRGLFPGRVLVEEILNPTRNAYHREVVVGQVVLTQSKVDATHGPIRDAAHRRTLAVRSQMRMDLLNEGSLATRGGLLKLWGCLVHMPSAALDRPSMLRLAFPFEDGTWEESYDIYELLPQLKGYTESPAVLTLRQEAKRARGTA